MKVKDLKTGEKVYVPTGFTNLDRSDEYFECEVLPRHNTLLTPEGYVSLSAENSISLDGRNLVQPYFSVNEEILVTTDPGFHIPKVCICGVLFNATGFTSHGYIKIG